MAWFPAYLVLRSSRPKPVLVRTGESFAAPDPWNDGKRAEFTVEYYKIVPPGWGRAYAVRMAKLHGEDVFKIRSSIGGASRRLPDSLSDLWRSQQVAIEALPRLLYELEPTLRKYDFLRVLHHKRFEWFGGIYSFFCFGIAISWAIFVPKDAGEFARWLGMVIFGLAGVGILLLSILFPRRWRGRCRKQMEWILANSPLQTNDAKIASEPVAAVKAANPGFHALSRASSVLEELMTEWMRDNGCPCRFPRFRATVERETDIFGASMSTWEQQFLMTLFDRIVKLIEPKSTKGESRGKCARCGATIRRWEVWEWRGGGSGEMRCYTPGGGGG